MNLSLFSDVVLSLDTNPFDVILLAANYSFPVATLRHYARLCDISESQVECVVKDLVRDDLVVMRTVRVNEPWPITRCLLRDWQDYQDGEMTPNLPHISRKLMTRRPQPKIAPRVVYATPKSAKLTGGAAPTILTPIECQRGLQVVEIFFATFEGGEREWQRIRHYVKRDVLVANGITIEGYTPDLATLNTGRVFRAFEYGARHTIEHLKVIVGKCRRGNVLLDIV